MAMKSFTVHEYSRDVYSRAILKQNVSPFEFICLQKYLKCFANRHFEFLNVNKKDNFFIEKSLCRWISTGEMHSFRKICRKSFWDSRNMTAYSYKTRYFANTDCNNNFVYNYIASTSFFCIVYIIWYGKPTSYSTNWIFPR